MAYKQHVDQSVKAILKCRYQRALQQNKQQKYLYQFKPVIKLKTSVI